MSGTMEKNWVGCETCNINFHKNDEQNHMIGKLHASRLKKLHPEQPQKTSKSGNPIVCKICKRKFTDAKFYESHVGSKTHKRNVREYKLRNNNAAPISIEKKVGRASKISVGFRSLIEPEPVRKKYKTRNITTEEDYYSQLKIYVTNIVSYLSLKLALDTNVQDFEISVNDKKWKSFGDIVINLVYKDRSTTYAIKCKQVSSLDKQVQNLNEAKIIMDKEYKCILELKGYDQVKFAIFTPCSTASSFASPVTISKEVLSRFTSDKNHDFEKTEVSVTTLKKKNEIINTTSDWENIFTFYTEDDHVFLPNVYVYTKQVVQPKMLHEVINKRIESKKHVHQGYSRYIQNWADGNLGGFYKLTKKDVILKLGELLLSPFVATPKNINLKHDSFAIWNEVMDRVDLTVVPQENFIISKISQPINRLIEDEFGVKIDSASRSINLRNKINDRMDETLRAYLFEEIDSVEEDIALSQIYRVFWKTGKIPILLFTEDDEVSTDYILEVICLMKQFGVHKKFLLKTTYPERVRSKCNMVMFKNFEDIRDFVNLSEISFRVSESYQISLESIVASDRFISKWITPNIFFDLALGKYSIKPNTFNKHDYEVESKIVLEEEDIEKVQKHLYGDNQNKLTILDRLYNIDPRLF